MYLCSKCFDILYSKYHKCTKCDFKNIDYEEENIEIDSKLAFQISILNKKGYKTKFCCSGHALDEWVSSYIYFEDKIDSCPEDWYIDDDGYIIRGNRNRDWIELDFITRENILTNYNGNLLKWVLELEPKENIKVYYVTELMDIYFKILTKINDISLKYDIPYDELYKEYTCGKLDKQTEIYNYFKDINNMDNILFMSGAIEKKDGDLIITEKGKEYKFPYTFYSDINTLN